MATAGTVQRSISDLVYEAAAELSKACRESGAPITDDSTNLHKFPHKLEHLLQAENEERLQLVGEKDARITTAKDTILENETEIQQLRTTATSAEEAHSAVQRLCEELKQKVAATEAEKQREYLKMAAEVDDLNRTKSNLEERLIELMRYKLFPVIKTGH